MGRIQRPLTRTCESLLRGLSCRRQSSLELAASRGLSSTLRSEPRPKLYGPTQRDAA
jgi:hypothetical protein